MYFRHLQSHSRLLSALVILFICGQLFVILIWGIVVTPFYNYGMFSEVIDVKKDYQVFEVNANGKMLRGEDYSPQEWDKIMLPLQFYAGIKQSNKLYITDVKRLLNKFHLSSNDADFLISCNYLEFEKWYKNYLENVIHKKIDSVAVNYRSYKYQLNKLEATASFIPLSQLCR